VPINSVLLSLPKYLMSFLKLSKGVLKNWSTTDQGFSGNVMVTRRSTDLLNGVY